jgi:hypothetical protein
MTLRRLALVLLLVLLSCCGEPAAGAPQPEPDTPKPTAPACSSEPSQRGAQPAPIPAASLHAMAAWSGGAVLIDPASARVVARASTRFAVEDLVYDPWRERWLVVEYDDASANQVSVWREDARAGGEVTLTLERTIETAGYCRVAATATGLLIFEDDGLQQRWHVTDERISRIVASGSAVAPASFVSWHSRGWPQMLALTARDEMDGPAVTLIGIALEHGKPRVTSGVQLEVWSGQPTAPRLARASDGGLLLAQVQDRALRVASGRSTGIDPAWVAVSDLDDGAAVEDLAIESEQAFVLLSGVDALVVVDRAGEHRSEVHRLGGTVSAGSYWAIARMLAFDPDSGVLLVGMSESVAAYPQRGARDGRNVAQPWQQDGWRWPVAMQERR